MHSRILDEHSKKAVHNYSDFLEAWKKYLLHCIYKAEHEFEEEVKSSTLSLSESDSTYS